MRPIHLDSTSLHLNLPTAAASVLLAGLTSWRGGLRQLDGALLLALYGGYIAVMQGWTPAGTLTTDKPWTVDEIEGRRDELFANRESGIPPFIT